MLPEIASAETAGVASMRAVAEGSPRTRASLDLVRPPAKPEARAWRARCDAVDATYRLRDN